VLLNSKVARSSAAWRFVIVGGFCAVLNVAFQLLAVDKLHVHYLGAAMLSFLIINAVGFALNKRYTFRSASAAVWQELWRYYVTMLGSVLANLALMFVLVSVIGLHYLWASVVVTAMLAATNFLMHADWTFRSDVET